MSAYVVLVVMQYSDDDAPDEMFGPFPSFDDAKRWMASNVDERHPSAVRRLSQPTLDERDPQNFWWAS